MLTLQTSIRLTLLTTLLLAIPNPLTAESGSNTVVTDSDFDAYQQEEQQGFTTYQQQFTKYRRDVEAAYRAYRGLAARVWGGNDAQVSDKRRWIEYTHDFSERSIVDFQKGTVAVEVSLPTTTDIRLQQERLTRAIERLLVQPADRRPLQEIVKQPNIQRPQGISPLAGLVQNANGRQVTPTNANTFARQQAQRHRIVQRSGSDGKQRTVIRTEFPLISDHLKRLALGYRDQVTQAAQQHGLPIELIYAVIETESNFNPQARSNAPAYGLMQLVPTSGGRDAYRYLFRQDKIPQARELYDPAFNIRLGTAYLARVYHDYLNGIKDPTARLWCTIAAYNTGSGNVLKAFSPGGGRTVRADAIARINRMDSEAVYRQLRQHLPHTETRNYVRLVRERMGKYTALASFAPRWLPS